MSALSSARRFVVGAVIFGGIMAVVVWQAGGLTDDTESTRRDPERAAKAPDDPVVSITPGLDLGRAKNVRVTRDGVAVVDGEPISYRVWEGSWERQRPLPGSTADERRLLTEGFSVLLFHTRPTSENPRPRAVEGPNTTRIDADEAELELAEQAAFNAQLTGNVRIVRHQEDGDLVLATESLDLEHSDDGRGTEEDRATSSERVVVTIAGSAENEGAQLAGTGLDANLSRARNGEEFKQSRITLLKDVRAEFLAPRGAATPQGGDDTAELVPVIITCDGPATLENVQPGTKRRPSRWLATFEQNVVVVQSPSTMRCERFEIEFEVAADRRDKVAAERIVRVVADGGVRIDGQDPDTAMNWSLRTQKSTTRRDGKGGYDVELEGGTTFAYDGTLSGTPGEGENGRVEVSCTGPASLHSDAKPARPGDPVRGRITFREDVVARQWIEEEGEERLQTEVRAPEITLRGSRLQTGDARLDPETLTATGNERERVHLQRDTLTANCRVLTWRVTREQDIERLLMSGRPSVRFEDRPTADTDAPAELFLDAVDSIEITRRHTEPKEGEAIREYAIVKARRDVVVRRLVNERESYRLSANAVDGSFDGAWQPTSFRGYDNVSLTGQGDRPGDRTIELTGDRLAADLVPTDNPDERWALTTVNVFGQKDRPARGRFREAAETEGGPRTHEIEAEHISYEENGTLFVARRRAVVRLERFAKDPITEKDIDLTITGGLLRGRLKPPAANGDGRPELLSVHGERGVTMSSKAALLEGKTLDYDRTTGVAVSRGRPARIVLRHVDSRDEPWIGRVGRLDSFVTSDEIRAEFDTTETGTGRPRRIACAGGQMRFFQFDKGPAEDEEKAEDDDSAPALLTVRSEGPIEVLPESASAETNVEIVWERWLATGRLERLSRLLADRTDLVFDPEAKGSVQDRVLRAVATGTRSRPARLFSPKIDATADRVESDGAWIDLLSPFGQRVRVTRKDPPESFTCRKARYNYVTTEFEATGADYSQPIDEEER